MDIVSIVEKGDKRIEKILQDFDERDAEGELLEASVMREWTEIATELDTLLPREYTLSFLADHGVIPPEWTALEEEVKATDIENPKEETVPEIGAEPSPEPAPVAGIGLGHLFH